MRSQIVSTLAFAGYAAAAACPFQELKRSGILSGKDIAKFEAVKRDPKVADELFAAHQASAPKNSKRTPQLLDALGGALTDVTNALGGGLGKGLGGLSKEPG